MVKMTMVSGQRQERVMLLEQVYELLKEQIIDRVYGPGDKLNIDAIAREMKVSSTPVREALARLVAEGLVAAVPYVGFAVSPMPTRKYYEDLYTFRNLLEPWAAAEAARWRPSDVIDEIKAAVEAMSEYGLSNKYRRHRSFAVADHDFHHAVVKASGNKVAEKSFLDLKVHLHLSRLYLNTRQPVDQKQTEQRGILLVERTREEHQKILDAILEGDPERAAEAMREHLNVSKRKLID
jgi:DNA-binding GntR family transcriptional regulator